MPPVILKPLPQRESFRIIELDGLYLCDTPSFFRKSTPQSTERISEFREWFTTTYADETAWVFGHLDVCFTSLEQATMYKLRWAGL